MTTSRIIIVAMCLAFVVITLGAYVRLSHAGLGCPDWPGCYGNLVVPNESQSIESAKAAFPERPFESGKAWKEMIHRYAAGILLLLVFYLTYLGWEHRKTQPGPFWISSALACLIIFQALLGMWTVTLLLKPVIVMGHLLGGMTVLLLLSWLYWSKRPNFDGTNRGGGSIKWLAGFGLLVLYLQILLGGWTSANYAALVCPDLLICRGAQIPDMDFKQGFTFWTGLGRNYEYGLLDIEARTAIHVTHRIGAVITFIVLSILALKAIFSITPGLRVFGVSTLVLLLVQVSLGILNVTMSLPINIAVAHNGVAALLLISVGAVLYHSLNHKNSSR